MSEEQLQDQHPADKLKLTGLDIVLETVIALILLTMWGMVFVSLLCPDYMPGFYDQRHVVDNAVFFSLFAVFAYWRTRYLMNSWNDKENTEKPAHFRIRTWQICLIVLGLIFFSIGLPRRWGDLIVYGLMCVLLLFSLCDWYLKRKQNQA